MMIDVGWVFRIDDPEDDWHGYKVIVKDILYNDRRSSRPVYVLLREDGQEASEAGAGWCERALKRVG